MNFFYVHLHKNKKKILYKNKLWIKLTQAEITSKAHLNPCILTFLKTFLQTPKASLLVKPTLHHSSIVKNPAIECKASSGTDENSDTEDDDVDDDDDDDDLHNSDWDLDDIALTVAIALFCVEYNPPV